MVGVDAVVALAGVPKPKIPAAASETVKATANDLLCKATAFILTPLIISSEIESNQQAAEDYGN
jgi:hypothetical protein